MEAEKVKRLKAKGWNVGTAEVFLQLSPEEAEMVEIRLKLANGVSELRRQDLAQPTNTAEVNWRQPRAL